MWQVRDTWTGSINVPNVFKNLPEHQAPWYGILCSSQSQQISGHTQESLVAPQRTAQNLPPTPPCTALWLFSTWRNWLARDPLSRHDTYNLGEQEINTFLHFEWTFNNGLKSSCSCFNWIYSSFKNTSSLNIILYKRDSKTLFLLDEPLEVPTFKSILK